MSGYQSNIQMSGFVCYMSLRNNQQGQFESPQEERTKKRGENKTERKVKAKAGRGQKTKSREERGE
jgi:hypothetical protein